MLNGEAPDIKVVANVIDDIDGKVSISSSREGKAAPQIDVLLVFSKDSITIRAKKCFVSTTWMQICLHYIHSCPWLTNVHSNDGQIGVKSSKDQWQERDVEQWEGLVSHMSRDHEANCVSEREANVKDPRNQVLSDNVR